jgi:hypothetical protein
MLVQKIPVSKNKTASACVVLYHFVDCAIKYAVKISIFTFPWVSLVRQVFTTGLKSLLISTIQDPINFH